jgi:hypothetical protein
MSDMLQAFVKKEMEKQIQEKYPHIQYPAGMCARVTQSRESNGTYSCTLKILTEAMQDDDDFPEIPNVRTKICMEKGDVAVVLLLYGGGGIHILGRYEP